MDDLTSRFSQLVYPIFYHLQVLMIDLRINTRSQLFCPRYGIDFQISLFLPKSDFEFLYLDSVNRLLEYQTIFVMNNHGAITFRLKVV